VVAPKPGQARGEIIQRRGLHASTAACQDGDCASVVSTRGERPTDGQLDLAGAVLAGEHQHVDHLPGGLRRPVALGDLRPQLIEDGRPGAALAFLGESDRPGQCARLAREQLQVVVQ
jgi:hypothetical protein